MEQNFKKNAVAPALQEPAAPDGAAVMGDAVSPEVTSSTDNLNKMLKAQFGEDFDINDKLSQDRLVRHIALNREQNERLASALEQDPRLAQMLVDMASANTQPDDVQDIINGHRFGFAISDERMKIQAPVTIQESSSFVGVCDVFSNGSFSYAHGAVENNDFHL